MTQLFAVDVGGTFTDIVFLDKTSGEVTFTKSPTTPAQPSARVLNAIHKSDLSLTDAETFFHGTTLGINTMLEHKGARTGLITTEGFRDVLEIARMAWPMYQLHWDQPEPLVERHLRKDVTERIGADGTVLAPLDEDGVRRAAAALNAEGVESIAVCYLHAYAFPEHELRTAEIIAGTLPHLAVTLSHQVTREYREYERTSTTVSDAMIKPRMAGYFDDLEMALASERFDGSFLITRCYGGVMSAGDTIVSKPTGGGYADPTRRDPARVARDAENGYVTRESALADYGVVLTKAGDVDTAATAKRRGEGS